MKNMAGCFVQLQRHKEMDYRSLEHKIRDLWIAEANRNTEIRRKIENVGRPKDNVKDETSKLGKQGEIKTKIIDEASDGDAGKVVDDNKKPVSKNKDSDSKKKPKDSDMDDMEAKTVKGGKTEVDTDPKTDDSTEDSTEEDKKSKKSKKQENKQIGAKGVKEETMNSKLTFGSPQSLIDSIAEAMKSMKGICPKCKKAKCMCEGWKEEAIDEVLDTPMKKLGYIAKNAYQVATANPAKMANDPKKANAIANRVIGAKRFQKKLNKEEVIDEGNPANKEKKNAAATAVGVKNRDDQHLASRGMRTDVADKIRGRQIQKEDVEQLDELSPKTLYSYGSKAHNQVIKTGMGLTKKQGGLRTKGVSLEDGKRKMANRKAGVELAHKKAQAKTNEEVEFSTEELARIEEIAKNLK